MLVLLKSLSLALWLFIMLAVVIAYRGNNSKKVKRLKMKLDEDYYRKKRDRYFCLLLNQGTSQGCYFACINIPLALYAWATAVDILCYNKKL